MLPVMYGLHAYILHIYDLRVHPENWRVPSLTIDLYAMSYKWPGWKRLGWIWDGGARRKNSCRHQQRRPLVGVACNACAMSISLTTIFTCEGVIPIVLLSFCNLMIYRSISKATENHNNISSASNRWGSRHKYLCIYWLKKIRLIAE